MIHHVILILDLEAREEDAYKQKETEIYAAKNLATEVCTVVLLINKGNSKLIFFILRYIS